ncbi:hypothetical protein BX661DRAFT_170107 [Kickxella alabastrina]|uniref:uncharacterized protein n=1 Tax=Kickxella alabastrina TaxID=61397 RepID=UPI00222003A2|nr:uncharacterized protein BX661DRAFT_170107 [Kickxella alabastrina]KAI7830912.1 hypothetical protein BX661DRAFT_170107 [Kickxella alabastrina]
MDHLIERIFGTFPEDYSFRDKGLQYDFVTKRVNHFGAFVEIFRVLNLNKEEEDQGREDFTVSKGSGNADNNSNSNDNNGNSNDDCNGNSKTETAMVYPATLGKSRKHGSSSSTDPLHRKLHYLSSVNRKCADVKLAKSLRAKFGPDPGPIIGNWTPGMTRHHVSIRGKRLREC